MKRFIGWLIVWTVFILNIPDFAEKLGKWLPIVNSASKKLTDGVSGLIGILPRAPECGTCLAFYLFWPTLVTMALIFVAYYLYSLAFAKMVHESVRDFVAKFKVSGLLLWAAGQLILIVLIQSWLLHRYSGLGLAKTFTIITFEGRVRAAHDKNFFLHASNIYGIIIVVSYLLVLVLIRWAWDYYQRHPEAKPPVT